jgi:hypothetical protein
MRTSGGNAMGTFNGRMLRLLIPLLLAVGSEAARAETFVAVADVRWLKFQLTPDSKVYLRNLDTCSASALGCGYNYYIDTSTQDGRDTWATVLSFMAQGKGLIC